MSLVRTRRRPKFSPCFEGFEDRRVTAAFAMAPVVAAGHFQEAARPRIPYVFTEPEDGREPVLRAIAAARGQIRIGICNLGDPVIAGALGDAVDRGVTVRVIVDRKDYLAKPEEQDVVAEMIRRGVSVHLSNPAFPRSFPKYLIVDDRQVLVMTMCLVPPTFEDTRDFGIAVANPGIIREIARVFRNDWRISSPPGEPVVPSNATPPLHVPNLIWGPVNAVPRLSAIIRSARRTLDVTTEELGDPYLEGLLIDAVNRGVRVRMITPQVVRGGEDNSGQVAFLRAAGVEVLTTSGQFPPEGEMPYMHAKTMVADGRTAYLGSIDLKTQQTTQGRELGIVFRQRNLVRTLRKQFEADWQRLSNG